MSGLKIPTGSLAGVSREELIEALRHSVGHQSHYAALLNQYDGGRRLEFATVYEWVDRLRVIGP